MNFIMFFTSLIVIGILYYEAKGAAKPNKNIILGVMIPPLELKNVKVTSITKEFVKSIKILFLISLVVFIPFIFLDIALLLIVWFLWFGIVYFLYYKIICKYNNKLKEVKRNNNWLLPNKQLLNIDEELTKVKDKMPVSKWWFTLAVFFGIIPFVLDVLNKNEFFSIAAICGGTSLASTIILFAVYMTYVKRRTVVYCDESDINIACNKIYIRIWSIIYVVLAIVQSITNTLIYIFMLLPRANENIILIVITLPVLLVVFGMIYGSNKIVQAQNKLISTAKNPIYVDSDDYWINGVFYKNPYDTRVVVEPRIGSKSVYNLATKKGKIIMYGGNIIAVVSVILVLLMLISIEFYGFNMSIDNKIVKINAPIYGVEFNIDDIEEVNLVDNIKVKVRTNGIGMDEYSVGNFNVEDYGKCKLYIYNDVSPYILIKVNGEFVFINAETNEETYNYFNDLEKVIN